MQSKIITVCALVLIIAGGLLYYKNNTTKDSINNIKNTSMNTDIKNMTELENNNSQYTKVTLAEIDQNPEAYNGARVEYTGVLTNGFERALIDGAIWFGGFVTPGDYEKNKLEYDKIPDKKDSTHTIHIKGILYTKNENGGTEFGHLGAARYELKATEFSVLD